MASRCPPGEPGESLGSRSGSKGRTVPVGSHEVAPEAGVSLAAVGGRRRAWGEREPAEAGSGRDSGLRGAPGGTPPRAELRRSGRGLRPTGRRGRVELWAGPRPKGKQLDWGGGGATRPVFFVPPPLDSPGRHRDGCSWGSEAGLRWDRSPSEREAGREQEGQIWGPGSCGPVGKPRIPK